MAGMMKLLAVVVGLLFLVPDTMQLSVDHPLHTVVERLNVNTGPFLGLVISSGRDEKILKNSSYYEPDASNPYITIAGRRFNFGRFSGEPVIYVLAGEPLGNVGVTVQILINTFRIKGIINYGAAATVSNQVFIADVVVPSQVAFTGNWRWEKYESEVLKKPSLVIGEYNVPEAGANYLEHITSLKTKTYTPTSGAKRAYFFNVHPEWVQLASQLNFGERPTVHRGEGVSVGSSDIYVSNVAYSTFLNKKLNVTAIDTESAAVVSTSIANGVPHIVFRGTSNRPGSDSDSRLSEVTAKNVLKTVAAFIGALSPKTSASAY
ncbi:bark storage protein A-like [Silene latifolia]|uniref:bark storage protein A-like n=1 Tax=Silene latifolia TaxID=37657 RepID=UPI003D789809